MNATAAIPVLRERIDGHPPSVAYEIIDLDRLGVTEAALVAAGLPVVGLATVGDLDAHGPLAVPEASVEALLDGVFLHGNDLSIPLSHPTPPITRDTSIPITAYADPAEQGVSDWQSRVNEAFTVAAQTLAVSAGTYRYFLEVVAAVDDVSTYCELMRTADLEKAFTHRGFAVAVYSPGDIEGSWGVNINGVLSAGIRGEDTSPGWWVNHCGGGWTQTLHLPSIYVKDRPLFSQAYMDMTNAHEVAHVWNMRHQDALCYQEGWTLHKTAEAFTSDAEVPSSCVCQACGSYFFQYAPATESRIRVERNKFVDCYNAGTCDPGSGTTIANGGIGSGYDFATNRGKYAASGVPKGTITSVCAFAGGTTGSVEVSVAASPQNPTAVFTESIPAVTALSWNCKTTSRTWDSCSLFIFRTGGTASVAYEFVASPTGDSWSKDTGTWATEDDIKRGYKLVITPNSQTCTAPGQLENGGTGGGFDTTTDRGKFFASNVPAGTITQICAFTAAASGSVSVALSASPTNPTTIHSQSIPATAANGWSCKSVSLTWTKCTLFVARTGGTSEVSYEWRDAQWDGDSYSKDSGSWVSEGNLKRGYKLTISPAGTCT